jgi:hypothetical protein
MVNVRSLKTTCLTVGSYISLSGGADPSTYKLTHNHLRIKKVTPARCGPIELCCCKEYTINNVDLTKVDDVDVIGEPAPCVQRVCCCANGRDLIEMRTSTGDEKDGRVVLTIKGGEGERVSGLIMGQIEEAQVMERE